VKGVRKIVQSVTDAFNTLSPALVVR